MIGARALHTQLGFSMSESQMADAVRRHPTESGLSESEIFQSCVFCSVLCECGVVWSGWVAMNSKVRFPKDRQCSTYMNRENGMEFVPRAWWNVRKYHTVVY